MNLSEEMRKIINLVEQANLPNDLEEKFGRVLFGDFQYENGIRPDHEKDTEYEEEIFDGVQHWFWDANEAEEVQNAMIELSKLKDNYPTLLKPESSSRFPYLYRTIASFEESTFKIDNPSLADPPQSIDIKTRDLDNEPEDHRNKLLLTKTNNTIMYKPRLTAEAWTVSLKMAADILANHFYGANLKKSPILKAKVPDNERLFTIKFTNRMYTSKQFEVVRVSDKPISCEVFYIQ